MALISNVVYLSQADYDTLLSTGSVNGHDYSATNIYIVDEDLEGKSYSISNSGTTLPLKDDAYYYFEAHLASATYNCTSFGVVHIDASSSTSMPILVHAACSNATSTSTLSNNNMIRLRIGKVAANNYATYIDTCSGSSSLSTYAAASNYYLKFWRLNL